MKSIVPVGIDLGTTCSAAAHIDASGHTAMIRDADGLTLTASVVHLGDETYSSGTRAFDAEIAEPERTVAYAKRALGSSVCPRPVEGRQFPPEVIQGCLLRRLHNIIETAVGDGYQAVVTVPAYFDEARRTSTWDAAVMSGLPLLELVNEPTAAALALGERLGWLRPDGAPAAARNVMVYDLGGGTFDVTVVRFAPGRIQTLATDGDCELGGLNWDERLADHIHRRMQSEAGASIDASQPEQEYLLTTAREAKHELSDRQASTVTAIVGGHTVRITITRREFEELTADLLERTAFTARQTLSAAGLIWSELYHVLLVGGASRMPAVRSLMEQVAGRHVDALLDPDEAVARGAAIFARYLLDQRGLGAATPPLTIVDVNAHALGIEGVNLETLRTESVTLIPRNTPLPIEVERTFVTRVDDQPNVKVRLLEGESSLPAQCAPLASAIIRNLPHGTKKGTPIRVKYSLGANGRLAVAAAIPGLGEPVTIELQRERGLSDSRVQRWKTVICRDGGFRDFSDLLASMLRESPSSAATAVAVETAPAAQPQRRDLKPAVEFGAPRVAADTLQKSARHSAANRSTHLPQRLAEPQAVVSVQRVKAVARSRASRVRLRVNAVGHLLAALAGLALGYYLLCLVRPDLNVLHWSMPGVRPAAPQSP